MAETAERARVRDALDALRPYLAAYVDQVLGPASAAERPRARVDIHALLKLMLARWEQDFAARLPGTVRHYLHELRDIRNRWAHWESFDPTEAQRAIDTVRMIARAVGAPLTPFAELDGAPASPPMSSSAQPAPSRVTAHAERGHRAERPRRQVDVMRELYARHAGDEERIIREYAAAERCGAVRRKRNTYGLTPEQYAKALLADGLRKGWLTRDS